VNLPKRFELAFTPEEIEVHQNVVNAKVTRYLVGRPGVIAGLNPTEFRDWYGSEELEDLPQTETNSRYFLSRHLLGKLLA
jgi:hypothetical protein